MYFVRTFELPFSWGDPDVPNYCGAHTATSCLSWPLTVFLKRRAAAWYLALASIIPGRERFSWNLSF